MNVSELGLVTPGGKVVWGKYAQVRCRDVSKAFQKACRLLLYSSVTVGTCAALTACDALLQVTNNPENDGCVNAVLLV